jgi:pSer/pThr/pTyr-binding forkhead associated (FHA) protein
MVRLIFRHISGSRATEIDVVPVGAHRELILGRAPSAAVRFDPRGDNRVGRHHARIAWSGADPTRFILADLGSRNGTFINGHRVVHPTELQHGDVVQLGALGPEIEIQWETSASPMSISQ